MKTQIAIIGAGPAGLLLGQLLHKHGIATLILERKSPHYVLSRIRAGILEDGTRKLLHQAGVGTRMEREGHEHFGVMLAYDDDIHRIDFNISAQRSVMVYGQTEVTQDLMDERQRSAGQSIYEVDNVSIENYQDEICHITYEKDGLTHYVTADFIVGCDGFHGVSRRSVQHKITQYEKLYPFGWLGLLADQPPIADELIYCNSKRGFALCSQRSLTRSRYYLQVPL